MGPNPFYLLLDKYWFHKGMDKHAYEQNDVTFDSY